MKSIFSLLILLLLSICVLAVADLYTFDNPVDKKRYEHFNEVLRCPTCQNQNLAGSGSIVSSDLRREVYEQIIAGRSDMEITDSMVARYGDHILYKPPFTATTAVLWLGPIVLFVIGLTVFVGYTRRRIQKGSTENALALSADEEKRLRNILKKQGS